MRKSLQCNRILLSACLVFVFWQATTGQETIKQRCDCAGLHAGITAEVASGYAEPSVVVSFLLLNDAEEARNTAPESWKLVIDGKELEDSDYLFENGAMPTGGYGDLSSGANFSFSKVLSVSTYFPEQREYKISWKSRAFQSPSVTIRVERVKK